MTINAFQLKALLLSVITEIKFGQPLHPMAMPYKKEFKKSMGLSLRASNKDVLKVIEGIYIENGRTDVYADTMKKFNMN